jgi:O-antigen/teichoic acid export membrane protein
LLAVGIGAVASVIIARELGVRDRGISAAVLALAVLCGTFANLGLPGGAAYAMAQQSASGRQRLAQAATGAAFVLAVCGTAVCLGLEMALDPGDAELAPRLAAGGVVASLVISQIGQGLLLTGATISWYAVAQVAQAALLLITVLTLALIGHITVLAVVLVSAGSTTTGAVLTFIGLSRSGIPLSPRQILGPRASLAVLRPYVGFCLAIFSTIALTQIVQRVDVLLVDGYRGARNAGLYAVAVQLSDLLLVVPAALGAVVFRRGARAESGHWEDLQQALRWTVLGTTVAGSLMCLVAGPLVRLVIGVEYAPSVPVLRLLVPGALLLAIQSLVSNYIAARGRVRTVVVAWGTGAVVGVSGDMIVLPPYGIQGAAIMSSASYLVVLTMHVRALRATVRADEAELNEPAGVG